MSAAGGNGEGARAAPALTGDDKILWGVVANAGRLSDRNGPRWSHVANATALGSNSSAALCVRFGFDPDELVGGEFNETETDEEEE